MSGEKHKIIYIIYPLLFFLLEKEKFLNFASVAYVMDQ